MATIAPVLHSIPPQLSDLLQEFHLTPVGLSDFGAKVFFAGPYVLKTSSTVTTARNEAERLNWLSGKIEVPEVVWFDDDYLLMTRLRGGYLSEDVGSTTTQAVKEALRRLKAIEATSCPFNSSNQFLLNLAAENVRSNKVHRSPSDNDRKSPEELLDRARSCQPSESTDVLIHGRLKLESILWREDTFEGLVDVDLLGIGDVYRDLTLSATSLSKALQIPADVAMTQLVGTSDWDRTRFEFHRLLVELC